MPSPLPRWRSIIAVIWVNVAPLQQSVDLSSGYFDPNRLPFAPSPLAVTPHALCWRFNGPIGVPGHFTFLQ